MVALYSFTILVGAFLLFLVQPMVARMVLPILGSSPSVWNTALVFYQAMLLAGYAYAHLVATKLSPRGQWVAHLGLVGLAALFLPVGLREGTVPPAAAHPTLWLLGVLAALVAIPFFVVATTSPLVQKWFSMVRHGRSADPYFLYAASNVGSLGGLAAYPLLLEPRLTLAEQSRLWTWGFALFAVLVLICGAIAARKGAAPAPEPAALPLDSKVSLAERMRWLALAAIPTALMMSVTVHLTTDVGSVPLLWAIPLGLYLLTFIIAFSRFGPMARKVSPWLAAPLLVGATVVSFGDVWEPVVLLVALNLGALFFGSLACHSELAHRRPSVGRLTEFYLLVSTGGVLGGAFCALLAPIAFRGVWEFPLALAACGWLMPAIRIPRWKVPINQNTLGFDWAWSGIAVSLLFGGLAVISVFELRVGIHDRLWALALPGLFALAGALRPVRLGTSLLAIGVAMVFVVPPDRPLLYQNRNFFGVLRVEESLDGERRILYHGTTLHGLQLNERPYLASAYYHPKGPMGDIMGMLKPDSRVAVLGLGVGTMLAYSQQGQTWAMFEIDPEMVRLARDSGIFGFWANSPATVESVVGDARVRLTKDDSEYDLVILDAYSSDAIPVHLITVEAMRIYLDRLAPGGAIALHISNRNLDLEPVVSRLAEELGLFMRVRYDAHIDPALREEGKMWAQWVVLARSEADVPEVVANPAWIPGRTREGQRLWTDDYSSILDVLRPLF